MKKQPITKPISRRVFYTTLILMSVLYIFTLFTKETPWTFILFTPLLAMSGYDWKAISSDSIGYLLVSLVLILSYPVTMLIIGIEKPSMHYYPISIYLLVVFYLFAINHKKS